MSFTGAFIAFDRNNGLFKLPFCSSNVTKKVYRIVFSARKIAILIAFLAITFQSAFARIAGPKDIPISSLMRRMSLPDFVKFVGPETMLDTVLEPAEKGKFIRIVRFAPVIFEGFLSICEATLSNDTVISINMYLPYRVHRGGIKPEQPYAERRFINATLDDFNKVSDNIAKSLGLPSVYSQTYIDYLENGKQLVFGSCKEGNITITINPEIKR